MACKCITEFTRSRSLWNLQTGSITASECRSGFTRSWPASASPNLLDLGLQVHLQRRPMPPCKYIFKARRGLYGDTGVTKVDRVTGSIYLADPGVVRHHLISISCYHTMKIHTLSFPTFGLTHSVQNFVDPCNCVDLQRQAVSYLLTQFLPSSNQNCPFSWIPFGCHESGAECWLWALCLLASLFHHNGLQVVHLWVLNMGMSHVLLRLRSSTSCHKIDRMCIYRMTWIIHAIFWCSEFCECNTDKMLCGNVRTTAVGILHRASRCAARRSWLLLKSLADLRRGLRSSKLSLSNRANPIASWKCSCRVWEYFALFQGSLGASRSTSKHWWRRPEGLGGLHVASQPNYISLMSMITTPTQSKLAVHFGYWISPTGGDGERKRTPSTPISPMWHGASSLWYHIVSECRTVFPLGKMLSAGDNQNHRPVHLRKGRCKAVCSTQ